MINHKQQYFSAAGFEEKPKVSSIAVREASPTRGASKLDTNSFFEDESVRSLRPHIFRKDVAGRIISDFAFWICVSDLVK